MYSKTCVYSCELEKYVKPNVCLFSISYCILIQHNFARIVSFMPVLYMHQLLIHVSCMTTPYYKTLLLEFVIL